MPTPLRIVIAKPGLTVMTAVPRLLQEPLGMQDMKSFTQGFVELPNRLYELLWMKTLRLSVFLRYRARMVLLFPKVCELLREAGLDDVVVFGGGIIPERDRPALYESGISAIFGPGTTSTEMIEFLNNLEV